MSFFLPFEKELKALDDQLAALPETDPSRAELLARLETCEHEVYDNIDAVETFLLSRNPLRPKTLDYVQHIFHDIRFFQNSDVRGDHLVVAGAGKVEIAGDPVDVIFVGQQTGPSSEWEHLVKLPPEEYKRWNQGMGFPDGYRKAVYAMDLAEQRGWPIVVFVDTHGADASEYSEEQGQAFAINEVIRKTTSLRTPSLSYIISLGASGGAIAFTPTNRTIMNEHATYMVISPGACASILFRTREPDAIRRAARGLRLTAADAFDQGTVDEFVKEGLHPGHRYPDELLAKGKEAVERHLGQLLGMGGERAELVRREKFFAMGLWGGSDTKRQTDTLAKLACEQSRVYAKLLDALTEYFAERVEKNGRPADEAAAKVQAEARQEVARMIYAAQRADATYVSNVLGVDAEPLSKCQWAQIHEYLLERRYGHSSGLHAVCPNGGLSTYQRFHPVCWIRQLTDEDTFREFAETIQYCSVDQLGFPGYEESLARGTKETGLETGLVTGLAKISGLDVVLAVNNFRLVGSSLCDEIGEKYRYAAGQAVEKRTPLVSIAMGGGARMQEGTPSMHRNIPKIHHALNALDEAGVPHISVICDPTLGGTAISYGLRGDYMIVVEGSANIGFTGKRVMEQFRGRKMPPDFQNGEWLLHRGFVDECVSAERLPTRLAELLNHVIDGGSLAELQKRGKRVWKPKESNAQNDASLESAGSVP